MSDRKRKTYLLAGLIVLSVLGFQWLRSSSTSFNLIFSPADFYKPLAVVPVDPLKKEYLLVSTQPYPGSYAIQLQTTQPLPGVMPELGFDAWVVISSNDERHTNIHELETEMSPYRGPGNGSGLILARFDVPRHIDRDVEAEISVNFSGEYGAFRQTYGPLQLAVTKLSDE